MDVRQFAMLPRFECMTDAKNLPVGAKFLTGSRITSQTEMKSEGQHITYYEVISSDDRGNIQYTPRYDVLTAAPIEERKKL